MYYSLRPCHFILSMSFSFCSSFNDIFSPLFFSSSFFFSAFDRLRTRPTRPAALVFLEVLQGLAVVGGFLHAQILMVQSPALNGPSNHSACVAVFRSAKHQQDCFVQLRATGAIIMHFFHHQRRSPFVLPARTCCR